MKLDFCLYIDWNSVILSYFHVSYTRESNRNQPCLNLCLSATLASAFLFLFHMKTGAPISIRPCFFVLYTHERVIGCFYVSSYLCICTRFGAVADVLSHLYNMHLWVDEQFYCWWLLSVCIYLNFNILVEYSFTFNNCLLLHRCSLRV